MSDCVDRYIESQNQLRVTSTTMRYLFLLSTALWLLTIAMPVTVTADVSLAAPFGDNMVLQRNCQIPVWGWSDAGDEVMVFARDQTRAAKADDNGKWMVALKPMQVGKPFSIRVKGTHNEVELENVVVGEVWICSGQSNMEWTVNGAANPEGEKQAANLPMIRHMKVLHNINTSPQSNCETTGWQVCSPQTAGEFSAVGYYFARKIHKELNVPIGLINSSWGGTIVEAWTSADSLITHPDFAKRISKIHASESSLAVAEKEFQVEMAKWQQRYDVALEKSAEEFSNAVDDSNWKQLAVPGQWEQQGFRRYDGIAWYRRSISIPESWTGKEITLSLGAIDDNDRTFVNGVKVGETNGWNRVRKYLVPAGSAIGSVLNIAVQVHDTGGAGGFHGEAEQLSIAVDGESPLPLAGKWKFKTSDVTADLDPRPKRPGFNGPNNPTALYNGMIQPLIPFAFKGAIWYQGESNARRAYQYRSLFPLLIKDWRTKWNRDLPFYWVQLANFQRVVKQPSDSEWAELREAQSMALKLPKTGEAVIIDIGDARDIHPKNKQDVGKRLALIAMKNDYGLDVHCYGPRYRSMTIDGSKIRLLFDHAEGIKSSDSKPLAQFAIAGDDKKFVWATATVDGNDIVVSSPDVKNPVAVRYAWANNPQGCNLTNASGIPASPFRTDSWPGITNVSK